MGIIFVLLFVSLMCFSDSLNFILIDTCITDADRLLDVECYGNLLYCADFANDIRVFNASDVENLIELGTIAVNGYPQRFSFFGHYLYSANRDGGLCLLDLSEGVLPPIKAHYNDGDVITGIWGDSQFVYAAGPDGFKVFSIENDTLLLKDSIYTVTFTSNDVYVKGDRAYVCNWDNGTSIVDISDKNNLDVISTIPTSDYSCECYIRDTILYVAEYSNGVRCYDVSDASNPIQIDSMPIGSAIEMQFNRNRLFVGNAEGIYVYYLNQNGSSTLIGFYTGYDVSKGISIRNDTVFSCAEFSGMNIYEFCDPLAVCENPPFKSNESISIQTFFLGRIKILSESEEICRMEVLDLSGRRIMDNSLNLNIGMNEFQIPDISSGSYFILLRTKENVLCRKIIYLK
ncbi:MAG: hypothetical protein AB7T10_01800 [bacterium]